MRLKILMGTVHIEFVVLRKHVLCSGQFTFGASETYVSVIASASAELPSASTRKVYFFPIVLAVLELQFIIPCSPGIGSGAVSHRLTAYRWCSHNSYQLPVIMNHRPNINTKFVHFILKSRTRAHECQC